MKIKSTFAALLLGVFALIPIARAQTNLTALLQQGLFEEQANRNLDAAIASYQTLATQFDQDRQLAATAVFRLGECYRAQGKTNEAATQYQRILRDFSDQKTLATLSQQDLAGMGASKADAAANENPDARLWSKLKDMPLNDLEKILPTLLPDAALEALLKMRNEATIKLAQMKMDLGTENGAVVRQRTTLEQLQKQVDEKISGMMGGLKVRAEISSAPQVSKRAELLDLSVPAKSEEDQEITRIQTMIQNSPDLINSEDGRNAAKTPLIQAAWAGWLKVAAYLLDHGADVNRSASDLAVNSDLQQAGRVSPLFAAVASGNKAMMAFLIERGADVNFKASNLETTPLHLAARKGFQAVVEALLASHADVNAKDKAGQTPLFAAVLGGQIKIVPLLIAAGANPNLKDGKDNTVLNFAIKTSPEMFKTLLAAGTDPNTVDKEGRTPLSYAVERDGPETVKLLLAAKADPNLGEKNPPLLCAIANGDIVCADQLLQAGAKQNSIGQGAFYFKKNTDNQYQSWRCTPLNMAIRLNQFPMVQLLLKFKADPNDSQTDGRPLLFSALSNTNILEALLAAKVDVDSTTPEAIGWTPLGAAVGQNNVAATAILLKHGANPNVQNVRNGMTPLHWAVDALPPDSKITSDIFELLLASTANPNVRNNNGQTPLDMLKRFQKSPPEVLKLVNELADLLRQHGALDELPDFTRIRITRQGVAQPVEVFRTGATLTNQFTLLETVMRFYSWSQVFVSGQGREAWKALPFPDFGRIIIRRPSQKIGGKEQEIKVSLLNSSNVVDCARDVPVQFGDVIEIPESVHALNANIPNSVREMENDLQRLPSLPPTVRLVTSLNTNSGTLTAEVFHENEKASADRWACLQKSLQLVVAGETTTFKVNSWKEGFLSQALAKTEARSALRTSSDLSRVTVTRKIGSSAKPEVFTVDVSGSSPNNDDLWLQDGDVIEVPEKQ